MSLPEAFRDTLLADASVIALVGSRIYPVNLPQEPTYPAVTYLEISGDPHNSLTGPQGLHWARLRVHTWGETYGDAYETAQAVEVALNGQKFTTLRAISALGRHDLYESAVEAYYISQDFSIWHTET